MNETLKAIGDWVVWLGAVIGALAAIYKWVSKPLKEIQQENKEQSKQIKEINEDTADLLCNQLTQEHDRYIRLGWCSASDKIRVQSIYQRYKAKGRNHVAAHYMDDIVNLPEYEPETRSIINEHDMG